MAGLMLLCGLRAGEVLSLEVADVDIGGRWLRVTGKGAKQRRVPLDVDVAGLIQTYLLSERPDTISRRLFVVAKAPTGVSHSPRPRCARFFGITAAKLVCQRDIRMRCGTRSAPRWPRLGWICR